MGLTKSKIRFYEKLGLEFGERAPNGYRRYTHEDAFRMNAFRSLLKYGFTVEDAIAMLEQKQSGEVFARSLEARAEELDREIELMRYRRARIENTLEKLRAPEPDSFEFVDIEDHLYAAASDGADFSLAAANAEPIRRFNDVLSASRCARIIRRDDLLEGSDGIVQPSYVIALPVSAAEALGEAEIPPVRRIALGRCLAHRRRKTRAESLSRESYRPLLDFLRGNSLRVRGDILLVPYFLNLDGAGSDLEELLVPVEG